MTLSGSRVMGTSTVNDTFHFPEYSDTVAATILPVPQSGWRKSLRVVSVMMPLRFAQQPLNFALTKGLTSSVS